MDLAAPQVSDIDFAEMAAGLSKIARFNGRYACAAYSDAQHSVFCADALYAETGDAVLAGCGLLHDGHEYLIGDLTRPFASLIAVNVAAVLRDGGFAPASSTKAGAARRGARSKNPPSCLGVLHVGWAGEVGATFGLEAGQELACIVEKDEGGEAEQILWRYLAPCGVIEPGGDEGQAAKGKEDGRHVHAVRGQGVKSAGAVRLPPGCWIHAKIHLKDCCR